MLCGPATDLPGTFNHREPRFDLLARPLSIRGTMVDVTVAQPSPHIVLVARRHIDLKRVCSCICLP
ncbi:Ms4527A family Cys-rich leader peptide [Mycobacterium sp. 852002-10029_SCH5224772]|uniref:Ms4527A family Cys-rich leader peptide n=1 Tax=Mycobacterium sp. 852002-10029_SCH5224772 TaxID=1834083 RepID=UPI003516A7B7